MRLVEFFDITEVKITKVRHGMKPTPVTVWINPTPNELLQLWKNKGGQRFRGITDEEGNTFWWTAYDFVHPQMAEQLGIDKIMPDGWYLFGDFQDKTVPALAHYLSAGETRKHASKVPSMRPFLKHPGFKVYPIEVTEARTLQVLHRKQETPHMGAQFGQDVEPAGRYYIERPEGYKETTGWTEHTINFQNPLVINWGSGGYRDPDNWKQVLARKYKRKGKALTKALLKDGYDGIITIRDGETSEIVDLSIVQFREGKIIETPNAKIIMNPSKDEFWGLVNRTKKFIDSGTTPPNARRVRSEALLKGLLHPETGDVFIWDPFMTIHVEVANYLISNYYGEKPSVQAWANVTGAEPNDNNPVYYESAGLIPFALGFWYKDRGNLDVYVDYDQSLNHPRLKRLVSNPVISEGKIVKIPPVNLILNPGKQQFWNIAKKTKNRIDKKYSGRRGPEALLKGILNPETGDFFIWDPFEATHSEVLYYLVQYYGIPSEEAWVKTTKENPKKLRYPYTEYDDGYIPFALGYQYTPEERQPITPFTTFEKALKHPSIQRAIGKPPWNMDFFFNESRPFPVI